MRKTYKYRLLGNKLIFGRADGWITLCCRLYNTALKQRISVYKQNHGYISCYDQIKQLPELKTSFPEYKDVGSQVLQQVLERLDKAYQNFFRWAKNGGEKFGFPRFKGEDRYNSFTLKQYGWKLDGKYLTISKIGRFKLRLSRPIAGDIKTITIQKTRTNKWYVFFSCDNVIEHRLGISHNRIGIDVGIKSFLVDSNGNKVENPHYLKSSLGLLRVRHRRLDRRLKGSNRRKKARLLMAKGYEKVTNQRNGFLHKLANYYVKNYGTICIEDLHISGLIKHPTLAQSIRDVSWGRFFELLNYKAEEAGREVIKVPRFEPTSKTCSVCGAINQDLTLNDRQWICKSCRVLHDRDYNSAKNICRVGQTLQELTYENTQCVSCESLIMLGNVNTLL